MNFEFTPDQKIAVKVTASLHSCQLWQFQTTTCTEPEVVLYDNVTDQRLLRLLEFIWVRGNHVHFFLRTQQMWLHSLKGEKKEQGSRLSQNTLLARKIGNLHILSPRGPKRVHRCFITAFQKSAPIHSSTHPWLRLSLRTATHFSLPSTLPRIG
jgi:hypothetical protein